MFRTIAVLAAGLHLGLAGLSSTALAQQQGYGQKLNIEYKVPQGLRYAFQQAYAFDNNLTLTSGMETANVQQQVRTRVDGVATVVSVQNNRPSQVRVQFAPGGGTQLTMNGQTQTQPFSLAGREVMVSIQNERIVGVAPVGGGQLPPDPLALSVLQPITVFESALRPGRPVGVDDQWQARIMTPDGSGQTDLTLQVAGFGLIENRPTAQINGQGAMSNNAGGMRMTGPVQTVILADVDTGLPIQTVGNAEVQLNGVVEQNGQQIQISGTGTLGSQVRIALNPAAQQATRPAVPQQGQRPAQGQVTNPNLDPKLVGVFRGEAIAGGGRHQAYVNTQLWWVFRRDGIVYYGAQSYFTASKRDYTGELEWTATGNSAGNIDRGRWQTQGRILTIQWENGNVTRVAYSFEPDGALVFRNPRTGKLINFFPRVH